MFKTPETTFHPFLSTPSTECKLEDDCSQVLDVFQQVVHEPAYVTDPVKFSELHSVSRKRKQPNIDNLVSSDDPPSPACASPRVTRARSLAVTHISSPVSLRVTRLQVARPLSSLGSKTHVPTPEAHAGYLDSEGRLVYLIDRVIRYSPQKGYYVSWHGWPGQNTWQKPSDMPLDPEIRAQMKKVRNVYKKSTVKNSRQIF